MRKPSPLASDRCVAALHVWAPGEATPTPVEALTLDWGGAIGDRHHGELMDAGGRQASVYERGTRIRNHRQVSIVDCAELAEIAALMGIAHLAPGIIADNIATTGIPGLTALPPMTRLAFGDVPGSGAVIMTGGENDPCVIAGRMVADHHGTRPQAFPKAALHRRGITGWVEHPGTIRLGDRVTVL